MIRRKFTTLALNMFGFTKKKKHNFVDKSQLQIDLSSSSTSHTMTFSLFHISLVCHLKHFPTPFHCYFTYFHIIISFHSIYLYSCLSIVVHTIILDFGFKLCFPCVFEAVAVFEQMFRWCHQFDRRHRSLSNR